MVTIRAGLDCLDREALMLLADIRNVRGARSSDERRSVLARSYRGDIASFLNDLRRIDLLTILRGEWHEGGLTYRASGIANLPKEELVRVGLALFTKEGFPPEFVPEGGVREAANKETASEDSAGPPSDDGRPSWLDDAEEESAPSQLAPLLDRVFPSWLVRVDAATTSRDPLGLQAIAGVNADAILPGLNVFTSRARYYSFLCWSLSVAQSERDAGKHLDRVHRLERLLVLSEALLHRASPDDCSYVGRRRGKAFAREHSDGRGWPLPTKILKNQTSNGALRLYRTSLADLELIEEDDLEAPCANVA